MNFKANKANIIYILIVLVFGLVNFAILIIPPNKINTITLATTTSTDNSGLLEYIHPQMTTDIGINVDVVAVGTGAALEYGRKGLADLVMVHARILEELFIEEGYGIHRVDLMYNDFVIVGPINDPANITGMTNSSEIFVKLYQAKDSITFVSRGDNSGTHVKELELWNASRITIAGSDLGWAENNPWYIETGLGMGQTLTIAWELGAYILVDRGTWLFNMKEDLKVLAEGSPEWVNPYGVILVNPEKFNTGEIRFDLAKRYVQWLISDTGQNSIDNYKINNETVFFADFQNHIHKMSPEELEFWEIVPPLNHLVKRSKE